MGIYLLLSVRLGVEGSSRGSGSSWVQDGDKEVERSGEVRRWWRRWRLGTGVRKRRMGERKVHSFKTKEAKEYESDKADEKAGNRSRCQHSSCLT